VFALPNETHRSYCEEVRLEVEAALGARFGTAVPIRLVVDDESDEAAGASSPARDSRGPQQPSDGAGRASETEAAPSRTVASAETASQPRTDQVAADDQPDLLDPAVLAAETEPAGAGLTPQERLKQAFPGAQEV